MTESVAHAGRLARRRKPAWTEEQKEKLKTLWLVKPAIPGHELADLVGASLENVYAWAHRLGLPRRTKRGSKTGRKAGRPQRSLRADPTGQRRKTRLSATSGPRIDLEAHDPRLRAGITIYPTSVVPVSKLPRLLKTGDNSYKVGKKLTKGAWKGQPIYTLTLEERATCPRSCLQWDVCYGNNMPFAHRIHDDGLLTRRLWGELAALAAEFPDGFIVRLHVLGDFSTVEYALFWRQAMIDFPQLNIFGFTARMPPDPVGIALVEIAATFYDRFRIRFSAGGHDQDCSEVVDKKEDSNFIVCPAESDPNRSCATCGLCMNSNVSISFVRH